MNDERSESFHVKCLSDSSVTGSFDLDYFVVHIYIFITCVS